MKSKFVDCFLLIGSALSLNNGTKIEEMRQISSNNFTAATINVSLTLEEINFINPSIMEVDVALLLHQRWTDRRLGYNFQTLQRAITGKVWRPKITTIKGHASTCTNADDTQFWRAFGDEGNVLLSEKINIKVYCTKNLKRFPFDSQTCELKFGTYRFPMDEVELVWSTNPIEVLTGIDLNEFELKNVTAFHEVDVRASGNFSVLVVQIVVSRFFLHYMLCTMLPCLLLVFISYLSFWMSFKEMGRRLMLSFGTVLFLICFFSVSMCSMAKVPYLKAIDAFLMLCLSFGILAMFENCLINYLLMCVDFEYLDKESDLEEFCKKCVEWIERITKIIYPLIYVFCVLLYLYCLF